MFADGVTTEASPEADCDKETNRLKDQIYEDLRAITMDEAFIKEVLEYILGVHSTKKLGTTHARRQGVPPEFVDYRARWRVSRKMQEKYADTVMPWPDIKCASKLCVGGACKYKLKNGCGISDDWLVSNVTPSIAAVYGIKVAAILAKPLLWACFDVDRAGMVPEGIRSRILRACEDVAGSLPQGENPVERVRLYVTENDGVVIFDEIPNDGVIATIGERGGASDIEWKNAVFAKVSKIAQDITEIKNTADMRHSEVTARLDQMDSNFKRYYMRPGVQMRQRGSASQSRPAVTPAGATLCSCPKDLYVLWNEYEHGFPPNKPARNFSAAERGKSKFKYSNRKVLWTVIDRMVNSGITAQVAIDRIYGHYGQLPVFQMTKAV